MSEKDDVAPPPPRAERSWTRVEDYLDLQRLWRRSAERRRRKLEPRTEPEQPRFILGQMTILLLLGAMLVLAVMIILAAVPGKQRQQPRSEPAEVGTAPPGWLGN